MCLPIHYGEIVYTDVMTSDVGMVTDRGRGLKLNERVRYINNTINISQTKRDICINKLACVLDRDIIDCQAFINWEREQDI